jgi:hypothetical protein
VTPHAVCGALVIRGDIGRNHREERVSEADPVGASGEGRDLVPLLESLGNEVATGGAGSPEDEEFNGAVSGWGSTGSAARELPPDHQGDHGGDRKHHEEHRRLVRD